MLLGVLFLAAVACAENTYAKGGHIAVIANKVGPFTNPTETYPYYSLPYCRPDSVTRQNQQLGELLSGDRKVNTPYKLQFQMDFTSRELCQRRLTYEEAKMFANACEDDYYFEMYIDDLPVWGYVGGHEAEDLILGHTENSKHFLNTHLHFSISFNGDRIIMVNVSTDPTKRVDITSPSFDGIPVTFTYSASWTPTTTPYKDRMLRYARSNFLPTTLEIHWLSIVNSFVLFMLLAAFLVVILMRVVRNDFTRYMTPHDEELEDASAEAETGWKLVHNNVFRPPAWKNLFAAMVGSGAHMFVMTLCLLLLIVLSGFQAHRRGSVLTAFIVIYTLTAAVGGYVSARLYKQLKGKNWVWNVVLTAVVFPGPLALVFCFLNTVAVVHSSTAALPFGTIIVVLSLYCLVALPLTVLGGIAGRNSAAPEPPCHVLRTERVIPEVGFFRSGPVMVFVAGFLPFTAISTELHYIFASVWGHKVYTLYGILLLAFVLLTFVTAILDVAVTYYQLAAEDYRWWWRSVLSGGSVGAFVFMYSVFFWWSSDMSGFLQTSFYFGYMAVASWLAFLVQAFVGHYAASTFVYYIYSCIKLE